MTIDIEIIPAVDLLGGRVVRLKGGDYSQVTDYGAPGEFAQYWLDQGAKRLHVVDLDGARAGSLVNRQGLEQMVATGIQVQFGGGIRSWPGLEELFELGVRQAILGTAAIKDPELTAAALATYRDRIVLALDSRNGLVSVEGWLEDSAVPLAELLARLHEQGLKRYIYTNIRRDGALQGPDLEGVTKLCQQFPALSCVLSGGISSLADFERIHALAPSIPNLNGVISGKALYEQKFQYAQALAVLKGEPAATGQ